MNPLSRRHFFFSAGMAMTAAQATRVMGANDKVRMGVVGLGGRGRNHMTTWSNSPDATITALCDVNQEALERGQAMVKKIINTEPKGYANMKDLFADKNVDAVSMPLPNHWHALATIWACQAGKDVYVEKPACHNIFEGMRMIDAARKYNRMVQIGSQSRSMAHKQKAMKLLQDGVIGKVYMAKGLCYKRRKSIGHTPEIATPAGIDWDKFLGPAPMRKFTMNRFKYNWHWFWDTGNGDIGNQGIHEMDMARWGLGRGLPKSVVSTGGKYVYEDDQETPNTQIATFDYGDAELVFEVRGILTGSEGGLSGAKVGGGNVIGNLYYGADGWMAVTGGGFQVYKGESCEKVMDEKHGGSDEGHFGNFLKAVRSRKQSDLNADVAVGVTSAALVHLANASYRLGRKLKFDEKTMMCPGDAEANKLLTRVYRAPYIVPAKV